MYTLIGSTTSPYVRKLRIFLKANNLAHDFKAINYLEANDSQYLKSINPINKIPILLIDRNPLYDSRVIFNYLTKTHSIPVLSLEEENILSAIDGAMDTSINLFSLRRGGLDLNSGNAYIERQKERVDLILNYLNPWVQKQVQNPNWNFVTMSMFSYLFWGNFREILDLKKYPDMQQFIKKYQLEIGVNETDIPV
jgi:glutathione S-transferase